MAMTFVLATLVQWSNGMEFTKALTASAIVLLAGAIRLLEGGYDAKRAADGNISKADVPVASNEVVVTPAPK
jgi:hypothetical protein